ncbi:P-type conjugative transfer protein TrbL [Pseudomonas viridiflava UASWS0038]|nr:hypothetical protein [Pseudomonas viridiflava]EKN48688.1 P-type conjugative transfer protein TrbL [Pseudomonas viridiflava UASWS0038]
MASLAVPGMENAHASFLFPVANDSPVAQNKETETPPGPDGTESNVIRPASDTSTNHGRLASLNVAGTASNNDPLEK